MRKFDKVSSVGSLILLTALLIGCTLPPVVECKNPSKSPWLGFRVLSANYGKSTFQESCALMENSLRQAIIGSESDAGGISNANKIAIKIEAESVELKAIEAKDVTVSELLELFCREWNIRAKIDGFQIILKKKM